MEPTQEPVPGVRDYAPADLPALQRIHEQMGLDYRMPDLNDPLFVVRKVLEVGGEVVGATVARVEFETYLWLDNALNPAEKNAAMHLLQPALLKDSRLLGAENLVCWVPENVEKKFAKRLAELGWKRDRDGWHTWSRSTE
jgi:hypothetical protein